MIPIARPLMGEEEKEAVLKVMDSGMLAQGPRVKEFESKFASMCGVKEGIATSNGTTALQTVLTAIDLKPGDEVITTALSFFASTSTIVYTGAKPVFVDVDKESFNIDAAQIEAKITPHTKAILPVHIFGQMADMGPIMEIAEKHGLKVIEDAAQAHSATYGGKKAGSIGDAGCFSFYPTKNMTTGEGGIITTSNDEIALRCQMTRDHGCRSKYCHESLGYNYRMQDLNAAIGLIQLGKLASFNQRRKNNAAKLNEGLGELEGLQTPVEKPGREHVYHLYSILCDQKLWGTPEEIVKGLRDRDVGATPGYPRPIYSQPYFQGKVTVQCPTAENVLQKMVHLPVHQAVTDEEIGIIIDAVKSYKGSR